MWNSVRIGIVACAAALLAACGGGDSLYSNSTTTGSTATNASTLTLLTSSPQLGSAGASDVTITAIVKDSSNLLLDGVDVAFTADSGALTVTQGTTDAAGQAIATLDPGGDYTNRTITVTATAGSLSQTVTVSVTGTSLAISGETSATLGDTTTLTMVLTDSAGDPIASKTVTVSSSLGNTLSASTLTTNSAGQVQVDVTADSAGTDTITASGQGATDTHSLVISSDQFQITSPAASADIDIGTCEPITVSWQQSGAPVTATAVSFSATRGTLYTNSACGVTGTSATTNGSGVATIYIASTNAGPSSLTAYVSGGPSTSKAVNFVATTPATLSVQADPTTIGPNDGSLGSQQQSTITATVRDAANNLVKGQVIRFSISQDNSGGTLTTATATTDSLGRASTTYISSAATTAKDGVVIRAELDTDSTINDSVALTVAQSALFVRLGTSNVVNKIGDTTYGKPYVVMVTDSNGNAVANATVNLAIVPTYYAKGSYAWDGVSIWVQTVSVTCPSEDSNENGILDSGEDTNGDTTLTPGNIVTVPTSVTTGSDGTVEFNVVYARDYAYWADVKLTASDTVAGTEASHSVNFWLEGVYSDYTSEALNPPGNPSPFGESAVCTDAL